MKLIKRIYAYNLEKVGVTIMLWSVIFIIITILMEMVSKNSENIFRAFQGINNMTYQLVFFNINFIAFGSLVSKVKKAYTDTKQTLEKLKEGKRLSIVYNFVSRSYFTPCLFDLYVIVYTLSMIALVSILGTLNLDTWIGRMLFTIYLIFMVYEIFYVIVIFFFEIHRVHNEEN